MNNDILNRLVPKEANVMGYYDWMHSYRTWEMLSYTYAKRSSRLRFVYRALD